MLLKVDHLKKCYKSKDEELYALNDVSFEVEEGDFVAIVGASGSGKSTLLHIVGGVDWASEGDVLICGHNITKMNKSEAAKFRREHIGLIYQFYNLLPTLNIKDNITLPLRLNHQNIDEKVLSDMVHLLNIEDKLNSLPGQLSGGQQQRVAIARAIITNPDIILADEPTGNLDQKNSREVMEYLKKLNRDYHRTILLVTHDMNLALECKRIITIKDGKIIKDEQVMKYASN